MKRRAALAAPLVVVGLALLPAAAGAVTASGSAPSPAPPAVPTLAVPAIPAAVEAPAVPDLPPVETAPSPVQVVPAPAPDTAESPDDEEMHAMLCEARPVFCDVDDSGRYITR